MPPPTGPSSTKKISKPYRLILWLNNFPQTPEQRAAFEKYMEHGGGWIGFHVAGYNDETTKWPWFVDFMGGAVFYTNNWPPLPAKLIVDDRTHPVTKASPRNLTTLQPTNGISGSRVLASTRMSTFSSRSILPTIPIGIKDIITERRPSRCLDEHEIQDDLHEHGPRRKRGKDLFRPDTKQAFRKRDSLARKPEIVFSCAGKSGGP